MCPWDLGETPWPGVQFMTKKALTGERFGSWEEFAVLGVAHTPRVCGHREWHWRDS